MDDGYGARNRQTAPRGLRMHHLPIGLQDRRGAALGRAVNAIVVPVT